MLQIVTPVKEYSKHHYQSVEESDKKINLLFSLQPIGGPPVWPFLLYVCYTYIIVIYVFLFLPFYTLPVSVGSLSGHFCWPCHGSLATAVMVYISVAKPTVASAKNWRDKESGAILSWQENFFRIKWVKKQKKRKKKKKSRTNFWGPCQGLNNICTIEVCELRWRVHGSYYLYFRYF